MAGVSTVRRGLGSRAPYGANRLRRGAWAPWGLHAVGQRKILIEPNSPDEIWAFAAGTGQTYNYWPSVVVAGDQQALEGARRALSKFVACGEAKQQARGRNVLGKTTWWGAFAAGAPGEADAYVGPAFPIDGVLLAQVLKDRVVALSAPAWGYKIGYANVSV